MQEGMSFSALEQALKQRCNFAYLRDTNVREERGSVYASSDSIGCSILADGACKYTDRMQKCLLRQVYREDILGDR